VNEFNWKLFAPLSIEGSTLLIEHQELPEGMAIRLGGSAGTVLRAPEAQELLLHLLTGESWVSNRLVWAAPRLHLGHRGYNLNERARLALIESLQSLLADSQEVGGSSQPQDSWQRVVLQLAQGQFASLEQALPRLGEATLKLLGLESLSLWVCDPDTRHLRLVARYPQINTPERLITAQDNPVYFATLERTLLVTVEDAKTDARLAELRAMLTTWGVQSMQQVVFHGEGGVLGVLWLENAQPRTWSGEKEVLALALGHLFERQIYQPLGEGSRVVLQSRKSIGLRLPEFEAQIAQSIALAGRHKRMVGLMRLQIEGLPPSQNEIASREIASCLRSSDAITWLGAQGYALLLSEIRWASGAARVAQRILQRLRSALGHSFKVAIGIAIFPQDAGAVPELWEQAEQACAQALEGGGGIRLLTPGASELQEAITRDNLTLHFQPVLRLSDLELIAVEALVRWPRGRGNTKQAGEFLGTAQQAGLIVVQDRWTLERVLEQAALWRPSGVNAYFSLNLSGETLTDPAFPSRLQDLLQAKRLAPEILVLELREEALLWDLEASIRTLSLLKEMGVTIALDDFGTSPIPMDQLKRLPLDWIKLSPLFANLDNAALAKAAIEIAHAIGAKAVAKGLEDQSQLTRLKEMGCDFGQGHLLGWPVPAEDLGALLVWGIGS
jgi:EAL domain-containing protein (putative c-di-GMP-specific phosphodiesterase class I)